MASKEVVVAWESLAAVGVVEEAFDVEFDVDADVDTDVDTDVDADVDVDVDTDVNVEDINVGTVVA